MARLGVITGLAREADCLQGLDDTHVQCAGADTERARRRAQALVDGGARALLSFGICGGLDPGLRPGTVIIATGVIAPDGMRFAVDTGWRTAITEALAATVECTSAPLAGCDRPLGAIGDKRDMFEATGAGGVDMESHAVAEVAARASVPFAAIRAVADGAGRVVPSAALDCVDEAGHPRPLAVIAGLVLKPWQVAGMVALALDARAALDALGRVALRRGAFVPPG